MSVASSDRRSLASAVRVARDRVSEQVTDEFLARHPDWVTRFGDRARKRGVEDARFHIDFLVGALESGGVAPFAMYARWAARLLSARGMAPVFLAENLRQIGAGLSAELDEPGAAIVRLTLEAGAGAALEPPQAITSAAAGGPLVESCEVFTQAALAGDRSAAMAVVREAIAQGHSVTDVYIGILQNSQWGVGQRWESNVVTVAQEHLATAVTQFVVSQMYALLDRPAQRHGPAIVTGIEGELHQLGGHMVADVLEADGWDVRFLGTNLPADGVLRLAAEHKPRVVGISAMMLFNLPRVVGLLESLRAGPKPSPKILVGGGLFRSLPELWREIGADGYSADLSGVVALARSL